MIKLFVLFSLIAIPVFGQSLHVATCSIHTYQKGDGMAGLFSDEAHILKASKTRTVYICDAFYGGGSIMQVTVPKEWFTKHCTVNVARDGKTPIGANCDEVYMGAGAPEPINKAAAPHKQHPHLKAIGYGIASVGVLTLCVISGCGFMGSLK